MYFIFSSFEEEREIELVYIVYLGPHTYNSDFKGIHDVFGETENQKEKKKMSGDMFADLVGVSFSAECRETSEAIKNPQVSASIAG